MLLGGTQAARSAPNMIRRGGVTRRHRASSCATNRGAPAGSVSGGEGPCAGQGYGGTVFPVPDSKGALVECRLCTARAIAQGPDGDRIKQRHRAGGVRGRRDAHGFRAHGAPSGLPPHDGRRLPDRGDQRVFHAAFVAQQRADCRRRCSLSRCRPKIDAGPAGRAASTDGIVSTNDAVDNPRGGQGGGGRSAAAHDIDARDIMQSVKFHSCVGSFPIVHVDINPSTFAASTTAPSR